MFSRRLAWNVAAVCLAILSALSLSYLTWLFGADQKDWLLIAWVGALAVALGVGALTTKLIVEKTPDREWEDAPQSVLNKPDLARKVGDTLAHVLHGEAGKLSDKGDREAALGAAEKASARWQGLMERARQRPPNEEGLYAHQLIAFVRQPAAAAQQEETWRYLLIHLGEPHRFQQGCLERLASRLYSQLYQPFSLARQHDSASAGKEQFEQQIVEELTKLLTEAGEPKRTGQLTGVEDIVQEGPDQDAGAGTGLSWQAPDGPDEDDQPAAVGPGGAAPQVDVPEHLLPYLNADAGRRQRWALLEEHPGLDQAAQLAITTLALMGRPLPYAQLAGMLVGQGKPLADRAALDSGLAQLRQQGLAEGADGDLTWRARLSSLVEPAVRRYRALVGEGRHNDAWNLFSQRLDMVFELTGEFDQAARLIRELFPGSAGAAGFPLVSSYAEQGDVMFNLGYYGGFASAALPVPGLLARQVALDTRERNGLRAAYGRYALADHSRRSGALLAAEAEALKGVVASRAVGEPWREARHLTTLGWNRLLRGHHPAAAAALGQVLETYRRHPHWTTYLEAEARAVLAEVRLAQAAQTPNEAMAQKALAEADATLERARELLARTADFFPVAQRVALARARAAAARQRWSEAADILQERRADERRGSAELHFWIRVGLAEVRLGQGAPQDAEELLRAVLNDERATGLRLVRADALNLTARAALLQGKPNIAIHAAHEAYRAAWCDGAGFSYRPALDEATRLLRELQESPPRLAPTSPTPGQRLVFRSASIDPAFEAATELEHRAWPPTSVPVTDTRHWDDEQTARALEELKEERLDWRNTTGSARKWWEAFETENRQRMRLVFRLAEELRNRGASITEFFLAYVYSNTDNILANLDYLDFTRLAKGAGPGAAPVEAAQALARWVNGPAGLQREQGVTEASELGPEDIALFLEERQRRIEVEKAPPDARQWWAALAKEAPDCALRLAEEILLRGGTLADYQAARVASANRTQHPVAWLHYMRYSLIKAQEEKKRAEAQAAARPVQVAPPAEATA